MFEEGFISVFRTHSAFTGQVLNMTFGAMPSIGSIDVASPLRSGAVERSPCYALPLNAEPPASHIDDSRLSAGYLSVLPARMGFTLVRATHLPSWGHRQIPHRSIGLRVETTRHSHILNF